MSATFFGTQATMRPEDFWDAVNTHLRALDAPEASWTEELAEMYRDGTSVSIAFRRVLCGRHVKP